MAKFSIIIPVFNRPDELSELLESLVAQSVRDFEVIIVEDGSLVSSSSVVQSYTQQISIQYIVKDNSGPALSRNVGAAAANGDWFIFLDSDCVTPPNYLAEVEALLASTKIDAFGGPDKAHSSFTDVQKAINYSMTSFFTTGGIRGSKSSLEKFHPRSFNMGISRAAFESVGGFAAMRFGEDVDLSIRLFAAGFRCVLIPKAWVYHKRRVDFKKFFRQVRASGGARVALARKHRGSLKVVHLLPAAFLVFETASIIGAFFCIYALLPLLLYGLLIFSDASAVNDNAKVGFLAVAAAFVQLTGYGIGFFRALFSGSGSNSDRNFYS